MSKLEKETCRSSFARRQQETIYAPWRQQWIKLKRETTRKAKTQSLIIEENDLMPRLNVHPSTVVGRRRKTLSIAELPSEGKKNVGITCRQHPFLTQWLSKFITFHYDLRPRSVYDIFRLSFTRGWKSIMQTLLLRGENFLTVDKLRLNCYETRKVF